MGIRLVTLLVLMVIALTVVAACTTSAGEHGATSVPSGHDVPASDETKGGPAHPHEGAEVGGHADGASGEHHDAHTAVMPGAREVVLTATEWEFAPHTISARVGEPVTIALVNDGVIEHEVEFAEFGLHLHTPPGDTLKGSFVPDRVGTFEFASEIPGHREAGMVGKLVVTE